MANVVITLKVMPTSTEIDLDKLFINLEKHVRAFVDQKHKDGEVRKQIEPVAFGLNAIKIIFVMDENIGTTEKLEEHIQKTQGVESVEVTDVRRALG